MIEELRIKLPEELVWNVLKYTTHPLAEILKPIFEEREQYLKVNRGGSILWNLRFTKYWVAKANKHCLDCQRYIYSNTKLYICATCEDVMYTKAFKQY